MAKLKILTESSLECQNTHYKQFSDKIDARNNGWFCYQDVKLSKYTNTKILFQLFIVIGLCGSQKMWKEGSKIF